MVGAIVITITVLLMFLIIGEAGGAALWLPVSVALSWMNIPYKVVQVVPY